jgi:hypothetical protein
MLEVEEKNNPQGAWGEELRKAAEQIPSLKESQLPVKVTCSALERAKQDEGDPFGYIIFVCVLAEQQPVSTRWAPLLHVPSFCIESCTFSMQGFAEAIEGVALKGRWLISCEHTCHGIWDAGQELGIGFYVWLVFGCERSAYQIMAREVAGAVRSHIRQVLLDFRAIEKGFNEVS